MGSHKIRVALEGTQFILGSQRQVKEVGDICNGLKVTLFGEIQHGWGHTYPSFGGFFTPGGLTSSSWGEPKLSLEGFPPKRFYTLFEGVSLSPF